MPGRHMLLETSEASVWDLRILDSNSEVEICFWTDLLGQHSQDPYYIQIAGGKGSCLTSPKLGRLGLWLSVPSSKLATFLSSDT